MRGPHVALLALLLPGWADAACSGSRLLSVPLASAHGRYEARSPSGLLVEIVCEEQGHGCEVAVYDSADTGHRENLLAPPGEWNGMAVFDIEPSELVEPRFMTNTRLVPVRNTGERVCLGLLRPTISVSQVARSGLGAATFTGGTLVVHWLERRGAAQRGAPAHRSPASPEHER